MTAPSGETVATNAGRRRLGRIAAAVTVAACLALWVYAYTIAEPTKVDRLDDRTFFVAAEPICRDTMAEVRALPKAEDSPTPQDRAEVVTRADDLLTAMVDRLRGIVPPGADAQAIGTWLDHWSTYVGDRRDFANDLADGSDARFQVTAIDGVQISRSIDHFAEVNDAESCKTPGDV